MYLKTHQNYVTRLCPNPRVLLIAMNTMSPSQVRIFFILSITLTLILEFSQNRVSQSKNMDEHAKTSENAEDIYAPQLPKEPCGAPEPSKPYLGNKIINWISQKLFH
ncbi:hypothetical protein HZS_2920 [Henneguya salminicola]|nr:hypothetical protein HZS_2920 [Henneguya salminicola]